MKKKRIKLKVGNIVIAAVGLLTIIFVFGLLFKGSPLKIEINDTINLGSTFDGTFKATFKGKDVTSTTKLDHKVDTTKEGKYDLVFTYNDSKKNYTKKVSIKVKDKEGPVITLNGAEVIVFLDNEYKDNGYKAIDNKDGDVTSKVKMSGKVDTSKEGVYELTYTVSDSSGNKTSVKRKVTVTKNSPLDMSVKDFTLDGLYPNIVLKETDNKGNTYSDGFIYMGDSVALYYVINKLIPGTKLWHKEGINPETALTNPIYINHMETNKTIVENLKEKKPKKVLLTLGSNSAAYMEPAFFIKNYKKLLEEMKAASPETIIIIQSIPPVSAKVDKDSSLNNTKINRLNYYILDMCNELNIPFLNSATVLKDSNGHLKEGYYIEDGIHLSQSGNQAIMKYFQNHAYEK